MPCLRSVPALAVLALALGACDSAGPDRPESAFTVDVIVDGAAVASISATAGASVADAPVASVQLPPLREVPEDPELESRYRVVESVVRATNAVSDDTLEVGYYRVTTASAAGVALVPTPAPCDEETCVPLVLGDVRLDSPGAVFFPVRLGAASGADVRFRPLALGGPGRLVFTGDGAVDTVDVPVLAEEPVLREPAAAGASVRISRGIEEGEVFVIVRRGETVRTGTLDEGEASETVDVPPGDGPVEVYLVRGSGA